MLLIADAAVGEEFAAHLEARRIELTRRADPYDALEALSRGRWPAVVLTAPREQLAGLCRACRRLQPKASLLAVCSPAAEPDVRRLIPHALNDYFIYPPTRSDWQRIASSALPAGAAPGRAGKRPIPVPAGGAGLVGEIAELFRSARSVGALEAYLAAAVGERLGDEAVWVNADELPPDACPLLLAEGDPSRALIARNGAGEGGAASGQYLAAARECLPAALAAARRTESLHRLAITDHLTGAYNRRYFYHVTDRILRRAAREDLRVTLLLYDIDDFKRYNDTYGHAAGDDILRETAVLMRGITRSHDIVARIGGDEFAVLFWDPKPPRSPDSRPPTSAYDLADRFRQAVRKLRFRALGPGAAGMLSISGGLASFPRDGDTCVVLLRAADRALKQVKETGKNAIRIVGAE